MRNRRGGLNPNRTHRKDDDSSVIRSGRQNLKRVPVPFVVWSYASATRRQRWVRSQARRQRSRQKPTRTRDVRRDLRILRLVQHDAAEGEVSQVRPRQLHRVLLAAKQKHARTHGSMRTRIEHQR